MHYVDSITICTIKPFEPHVHTIQFAMQLNNQAINEGEQKVRSSLYSTYIQKRKSVFDQIVMVIVVYHTVRESVCVCAYTTMSWLWMTLRSHVVFWRELLTVLHHPPFLEAERSSPFLKARQLLYYSSRIEKKETWFFPNKFISFSGGHNKYSGFFHYHIMCCCLLTTI